MFPSNAAAKLKRRSVTPARLASPPMRMKRGTATSVNEFETSYDARRGEIEISRAAEYQVGQRWNQQRKRHRDPEQKKAEQG